MCIILKTYTQKGEMMPRHRKRRRLGQLPGVCGMYPFGQGLLRRPVYLALEEYESIRLADYLGMDHAEGAGLMNVSRSTFTRIYERARQTIAKALVEGHPIFIRGGAVDLSQSAYRCSTCDHRFSAAPELTNNCPECGKSTVHDISHCFLDDFREHESFCPDCAGGRVDTI
ncbi:MAG: DUF134 domain-containing protein [Spirochaetota bacterium]